METVVQQSRAQLETVMNQLATTTQEMETLQKQSFQASLRANDAKTSVDTVAQRVQAIENEVLQMRGNGSRPMREVNFVDIKTLKPPMFKGGTENFQSWAKKAKNYLDANCDGLRVALEKIEFSKEQVDEMVVDSFGFTDNYKIDKKLNQFLMAYTDMAAMTFVENAHGSGFEAWRKLTAEYDPMSTQAGFNKMSTLMHPVKAKTDVEISWRIEQWEAEERRYNERTRNKFPEDWRLEILVGMLPTDLEKEYRTRIVAPDSTYSGIRAKIMDHVHRLTSISVRRMPTPMDCSTLDRQSNPAELAPEQGTSSAPITDCNGEASWTFEHDPTASPDYDEELYFIGKGAGKYGGRWVSKGKGKGKGGKGKGGKTGKGKGKFDGECGTCGKVCGQRAATCKSGLPPYQHWNRQKGKGTNSLEQGEAPMQE